jgi:hypothetical protein
MFVQADPAAIARLLEASARSTMRATTTTGDSRWRGGGCECASTGAMLRVTDRRHNSGIYRAPEPTIVGADVGADKGGTR